jgi:hypothetical protein
MTNKELFILFIKSLPLATFFIITWFVIAAGIILIGG